MVNLTTKSSLSLAVAILVTVSALWGIAMGIDALATDNEVVASLKSQKRLTDLQYLSQAVRSLNNRIDFLRYQIKESPANNDLREERKRIIRLRDEFQRDHERLLRGGK